MTFTIWKAEGDSWSPVSRNAIDELVALPGAPVLRIQLLDDTFRFGLERYDQTRDAFSESDIEAVLC